MSRFVVGLAALLAIVPSTRLDEVEPNDAPATAMALSLGDTIRGTLSAVEDVDYFAIRPAGDAFARFEISGQNLLATRFDFYREGDSDAGVVHEGRLSSVHVGLRGGDAYYVGVEAWSQDGTGAYTLSLLPPETDRSEAESNDRPADATPLPDGQAILGASPPGDTVDYFDLPVPAHHVLVLTREAPGPSDVAVDLVAPGRRIEFGDRRDRVSHYFEAPATALARASATYCYDYLCSSRDQSSLATYFLTARIQAPGPGDPTERLRDPTGAAPHALAVGPEGELYVAEGDRVVRVDDGGETIVYSDAAAPPRDVILDPTGRLLVSTTRALYRIRGDGTPEALLAEGTPGVGGPLALDPDGTIWVGAFNRSPDGTVNQDLGPVLGLAANHVRDFALSPDGTLHVVAEDPGMDADPGGYVILSFDKGSETARRIFSWLGEIRSIAFDADGNLYVATSHNGVLRLDPDGNEIDAPFALRGLDGVVALSFGRSGTGEPTRDLLALDETGALYRLNPDGVPAPGAPQWVPPPAPAGLSLDAVADALLGDDAALGAEERAWADLAGNWNGMLDLGDFVALADGDALGTVRAPSAREGSP